VPPYAEGRLRAAVTARLPAWAPRAVAGLRATPVATAYAALLLVVNVILALVPEHVEHVVAHATSTNLVHLALDPLFVLPTSALVDEGQTWLWVPLTLILLGGLERVVGSRRALLVTFGAHCLASLLSEGVLLARIATNHAPTSDIHLVDVGPSYMMLAALAACLVVGGPKLRITALAIGALLVPGLVSAVPELDMSAVGHLSSLLLGAALMLLVRQRDQRRAPRTSFRLRRPPAPASAGADTYR
jgi:hypothetical protein